ncbi:MAG: ParA family protein [Eubacteriales bacterium]
MAKVIALSNEKGGVGKSTVSTTLAYLLTKNGNKVCVLDYDGQANASMILGLNNVNQIQTSIATLMHKIIKDEPLPNPDSYILTMENGVDLIPSNTELFTLERELNAADFREEILVQLVNQIRPLYDYIIIDCMPQMGTALLNVFLCADSVIIPTQSELLSAKGLSELLRHIKKMQRSKAHNLKIEGVLINMDSSTTNNSKVVSEFLMNTYGSDLNLFQTKIPRSIKVAEASIYQQTICEYDPTHPVSLAYENLLKELIENAKTKTA